MLIGIQKQSNLRATEAANLRSIPHQPWKVNREMRGQIQSFPNLSVRKLLDQQKQITRKIKQKLKGIKIQFNFLWLDSADTNLHFKEYNQNKYKVKEKTYKAMYLTHTSDQLNLKFWHSEIINSTLYTKYLFA